MSISIEYVYRVRLSCPSIVYSPAIESSYLLCLILCQFRVFILRDSQKFCSLP